MKFKREFVPAHREYFVTLVRKNGQRELWYLSYCFDTPQAAQLECDKRNPHYKHGQLVPDYVDRPDSWSWGATMKFKL